MIITNKYTKIEAKTRPIHPRYIGGQRPCYHFGVIDCTLPSGDVERIYTAKPYETKYQATIEAILLKRGYKG